MLPTYCDPYNILMAERIAGIIGLDICGIDVMTTDIAIPLNEDGGAVLEVNAAPGFRMHISPTYGLPRNVAEPVVDMLFPRTASPYPDHCGDGYQRQNYYHAPDRPYGQT